MLPTIEMGRAAFMEAVDRAIYEVQIDFNLSPGLVRALRHTASRQELFTCGSYYELHGVEKPCGCVVGEYLVMNADGDVEKLADKASMRYVDGTYGPMFTHLGSRIDALVTSRLSDLIDDGVIEPDDEFTGLTGNEVIEILDNAPAGVIG